MDSASYIWVFIPSACLGELSAIICWLFSILSSTNWFDVCWTELVRKIELIPSNSTEGNLIWCHGLNICILPKFICWNPNWQGSGVGRWGLGQWLGQEDRASWRGLASYKRDPREVASLFYNMGLQQKHHAV